MVGIKEKVPELFAGYLEISNNLVNVSNIKYGITHANGFVLFPSVPKPD